MPTIVKSEDIIISAPMSFVGAAQRINKITRNNNTYTKWLLLVPLAVVLVLLAWSVVFVWYMIFGIWLVPYRLIRRSQRKAKRDNLRHRELLEKIESRAKL